MEIAFPELAALRLGLGLSPRFDPPADPDALMASVAAAGPGPEAVSLAAAIDANARWQAARKAAEGGGAEAVAAADAIRGEMAMLPQRDLQRRMVRALADGAGFGERLVQFWADHFTLRAKSVKDNLLVMAFVDEAIRPHLSGRFAEMLIAATTHPGMLVYLDQVSSTGPGSVFARRRRDRGAGLNENLAREVLELHTMGAAAGYAQADVRQLAELLTGLSWAPGRPGLFQLQMAEPGPERVLGRDYGGRGTDGLAEIRRALADLAAHPATALHLSRKLVTHFLTDAPDEPMVEEIAAVWRESGGDLPAVHRALAGHSALAASFRQKARQPFDFLAAALRALGLAPETVAAMDDRRFRRIIAGPMARMGQPWGRQVGPDGWAEAAEAWITPQALAARIEWALRLPRDLVEPLPDPRALLAAALGGTAGEALTWAVPRAESVQEGVALVLASTEFNRR